MYPAAKIEPGTVGAYDLILADVADDVLLRATVLIGRESRFFPSASEVLEGCRRVQGKRKPGARQRAWVEVSKACSDGGWPEGGFVDPVVERVLQVMGGLRLICESESPSWTRKEFFEHYAELSEMDEQIDNELFLPMAKAAGYLELVDE